MDPNEYQKLAARTECDQDYSRDRIAYNKGSYTNLPTRLLHSVLGMTGEVGELASNLEKWLYYGQEKDNTNLKEELGDLLWYVAEMCNAAGFELADVMEANIRKLQTRYPKKFDTKLAKEENRNREAEAKDLAGTAQQTGSGFAEPPEEAEPQVITLRPVGDDLLCVCHCGNSCQLGKTGMQTRCNHSELHKAEVDHDIELNGVIHEYRYLPKSEFQKMALEKYASKPQPELKKEDFETARQIASWLEGQVHNTAIKAIEAAEKRFHNQQQEV